MLLSSVKMGKLFSFNVFVGKKLCLGSGSVGSAGFWLPGSGSGSKG